LRDRRRYLAQEFEILAMNLERGIAKALQYSVVGFMIPIVVICAATFWNLATNEVHPIDRENDIAQLPGMVLIPSIGIAILFGLSALGSFTPNRGLSFLRSLIFIAGSTLAVIYATYSDNPKRGNEPIDPSPWITEIAIPMFVALMATTFVLYLGTGSETTNTNLDADSKALDSAFSKTAR
jgi:hypothetical protein